MEFEIKLEILKIQFMDSLIILTVQSIYDAVSLMRPHDYL